MKRIAVAEDNSDNRLLVQAILDGEYEVTEYEDGPTALIGIKQDRPDLMLPGTDGGRCCASCGTTSWRTCRCSPSPRMPWPATGSATCPRASDALRLEAIQGQLNG